MIEDKNTEFKREYVEDIKKTLIAFANTDGGNVFIGIDDEGNAVEIKDVDGVMLQISNVIRDAIKPDLTMFCDITVETIQNKNVVKIAVNRGTARPYYLAAKGIRPETKVKIPPFAIKYSIAFLFSSDTVLSERRRVPSRSETIKIPSNFFNSITYIDYIICVFLCQAKELCRIVQKRVFYVFLRFRGLLLSADYAKIVMIVFLHML